MKGGAEDAAIHFPYHRFSWISGKFGGGGGIREIFGEIQVDFICVSVSQTLIFINSLVSATV